MSILVAEVYEALVEAGASEQKAKAAAAAIPLGDNLATKKDIADLRLDMAGMRKDIDFLRLFVFRFLLPVQLLIVGLAVKAAFFPG